MVLCLARTELEADEVRRAMAHEGAESIDAARHRWWLGIKDAVQESYNKPNPDAHMRADPFLRGFEAAQIPEFHGKPWEQVLYTLVERYSDWSDDRFRRGFDCGQLPSTGTCGEGDRISSTRSNV